jgi:ribosome hibernation promoting factor
VDSVERVDVRIQDVNGPRGGVDKQCSITADLKTTRRRPVVKVTSADVYAAVQAASVRLGEAVFRALSRRRWLDRFARPREPRAVEMAPSTPRDEERRIGVTITREDDRSYGR